MVLPKWYSYSSWCFEGLKQTPPITSPSFKLNEKLDDPLSRSPLLPPINERLLWCFYHSILWLATYNDDRLVSPNCLPTFWLNFALTMVTISLLPCDNITMGWDGCVIPTLGTWIPTSLGYIGGPIPYIGYT